MNSNRLTSLRSHVNDPLLNKKVKLAYFACINKNMKMMALFSSNYVYIIVITIYRTLTWLFVYKWNLLWLCLPSYFDCEVKCLYHIWLNAHIISTVPIVHIDSFLWS